MSGDDVVVTNVFLAEDGGFSLEVAIIDDNFDAGAYYVRVFNRADPSGGGADCRYLDSATIQALDFPEGSLNPPDDLPITNPEDGRFMGAKVAITDTACPSCSDGCTPVMLTVTDDCDANNMGSITALATAGVGPFFYQWDAAAGGQTTATASGLGAGTYTVTVIDQGNANCQTVATGTVSGVCFRFMVDTTATPCPSASSGSATVSNLTGSAGNITYAWSVPGAPNAATITGLGEGTYSVAVSDTTGSAFTQDFEIVAANADVTFSLAKTDPTCGPGVNSGVIMVNGLTGASEVFYSNGGAEQGPVTTGMITGLSAGTYTVRAAAAAGAGGECDVSMMITLEVDGDLPNLVCGAAMSVDLCPDDSDTFDSSALATLDGTAIAASATNVVTDGTCTKVVRYTFTATNICGPSMCMVDVTFNAPALAMVSTLPAALQDMSLACDAAMPSANPAAVLAASVGCGQITVTAGAPTAPAACKSDAPATQPYTITDGCGNSISFTQSFTYAADTTGPVLDPIAQTDLMGCNGVPAADPSVVTGTDDCGGAITVALSNEATTPGTAGRSVLTRTWTGTDACGNESTVNQVITFVDSASVPVFANLPATANTNSTDCMVAVPDFATGAGLAAPIAFTSGNAGVMLAQTPAAGTVLTSPGTHRVIVVASNVCGNTATSYIDLVVECTGLTAGSIGGIVFNDFDADGIQTGLLEMGISGVTVYLDANENGVLDPTEITTVSSDDGSYSFAGVPYATYSVRLAPSTNLVQTAPAGGAAQVVNVTDGTAITGIDFGNQGQATICGRLFEDTNNSGTFEPGEPGVPGIVVVITVGGSNVLTATTDADGKYAFNNLPPGFSANVSYDATQLSALLNAGPDTSFTVDVAPAGNDAVNFVIVPIPTAITLAYFSAEGDTVSWGTSWEQNSLGFIINRTVDGETSTVSEGLILALGGGTDYSFVDENPPAAGTLATYTLVEVETDLNTTEYGPAVLVHAASPAGGEAQVVDASAGVDFVSGDADSIILIGLDADAELVDVTDAANPIPLKGSVIETEGSTGRYISWPAGRTIQTK